MSRLLEIFFCPSRHGGLEFKDKEPMTCEWLVPGDGENHRCLLQFSTPDDFAAHIKKDHLKNVFPRACCWSECDEGSFINKQQVVKHALDHANQKLLFCGTCEEAYVGNTCIKNLFGTNAGFPVTCDLCYQTFPEQSSLKKHRCFHRIPPQRSNACPCNDCFRLLTDTKKLRGHMNICRTDYEDTTAI